MDLGPRPGAFVTPDGSGWPSPRGPLTRLALALASRPPRLAESRARPGLVCRLGDPELGRRLRAVDLVAADIDECLFPGFSQTVLGHLTVFEIAARPEKPRDLALLPQLLHGGLYIRRVSLLARWGRMPENQSLMERYERSMRGVPEVYFLRGARLLPGLSYPGALDCLALLARRAVVGTVSFGIAPIARAFAEAVEARLPEARLFTEANRLRFAPDRNGRPVFVGYERPLRCRPEDKADILSARLSRHGARCPLVIGHGPDEVPMAELARSLGGLSLGFCPRPEDASHFDLVVEAPDFTALVERLRSHLR